MVARRCLSSITSTSSTTRSSSELLESPGTLFLTGTLLISAAGLRSMRSGTGGLAGAGTGFFFGIGALAGAVGGCAGAGAFAGAAGYCLGIEGLAAAAALGELRCSLGAAGACYFRAGIAT